MVLRSLVTFILGDEEFAVRIEQIVSILDAQKHGYNHGGTQHRPVIRMRNGSEAAIIDLCGLLSIQRNERPSGKAYCLVLDCGGSYIAFVVDRINELLTLPEEGEAAVPNGEATMRNNVNIQHLRLGNREVNVLNPGGQSADEWVLLFKPAASSGTVAQLRDDALPDPIEDRHVRWIGMRHDAPAPDAETSASPMNRNMQGTSISTAIPFEET